MCRVRGRELHLGRATPPRSRPVQGPFLTPIQRLIPAPAPPPAAHIWKESEGGWEGGVEGRGRATENVGAGGTGEGRGPLDLEPRRASSYVSSPQLVHPSNWLQTEKLRPREGPRYASGRRGQVWRSRRDHCSDPLTARLPRPAPRTRRARALSWHLVSVCLSTRLPPHGDSWMGGGAEREKRGRRPPSKAAQVPGCWSLSRQAGAGALEYLISRQVEDEVAAAISGQPLGLRVRGSCSRNSRRGVGAARL